MVVPVNEIAKFKECSGINKETDLVRISPSIIGVITDMKFVENIHERVRAFHERKGPIYMTISFQRRTIVNSETYDRNAAVVLVRAFHESLGAHLSVLITPCMKPYACHPATIIALRLAASRTSLLPHGVPLSTPSNLRTRVLTHSPSFLRAFQSPCCCPPPKKNMFVGGFKASKEPMRKNDGATRARTHADSTRSRSTGVAGREMRDKERVVGTPRACMACATAQQQHSSVKKQRILPSPHKNSRIEDRTTARPSALRENGVLPAPFSCTSNTVFGSSG